MTLFQKQLCFSKFFLRKEVFSFSIKEVSHKFRPIFNLLLVFPIIKNVANFYRAKQFVVCVWKKLFFSLICKIRKVLLETAFDFKIWPNKYQQHWNNLDNGTNFTRNPLPTPCKFDSLHITGQIQIDTNGAVKVNQLSYSYQGW